MQQQVVFPSGTVNYYFSQSVSELPELVDMEHAIFVTDEHIASLYPQIFKDRKTLVLPAGENSKDINTITTLSTQLLEMEATRNTLLIGVGGGAITDITGFLASVYMRGVQFGFVPTSLLGMVDAAIGGKNGVNVGMHKNILGTVCQPEFIFFDTNFLQTLPNDEWSNGFAEIIKYACIFDEAMFAELNMNDLAYYKGSSMSLSFLIGRCVAWKNKIVVEDEQEHSKRKLLNFGHTVGHAVEKLYDLPHGQAVGIGMVVACLLSEGIMGIKSDVTLQLLQLLQRYNLPVSLSINVDDVMKVLKNDKKRKDGNIDYILLSQLGKGIIYPLPFAVIEKALSTYESND